MIAGIISAYGRVWHDWVISKFTYFPDRPLELGANQGEVFVGRPDDVPPHVDILKRVNGAWSVTSTLSAPVSGGLAFGFGASASGDSLVIRGFGLDYRQIFYLYHRGVNGWEYAQNINDFETFSIVSTAFTPEGHFVVLTGDQKVTIFIKTGSTWATVGTVQLLAAYLLFDDNPRRLIVAGSTILVSCRRGGNQEFATLPMTWVGGGWVIGTLLREPGLIMPVCGGEGRVLFYKNAYPLPYELVEYTLAANVLTYSHSLAPPLGGFDPENQDDGEPRAVYVGNRLIVPIRGFSGKVLDYRLSSGAANLAYTITLPQADKYGPVELVSDGAVFALWYQEGVYVPDEWGGYVDDDRTGLYIAS